MANFSKIKPILPVLLDLTSFIKTSPALSSRILLSPKGNFSYHLPSKAIHSTVAVQQSNFSAANATISNTLLELEHQLNEVKIFPDEQIIQV